MKKRKWIVIIIFLLVVLFTPIPKGPYKDGGTREYVALTYRLINWKRLHDDGIYKKTNIYFDGNRFKTIDELWEIECKNVEHKFVAIIREINGDFIFVEAVEGEPERASSDRISFDATELEELNVKVGEAVLITYKGGIMESYPAQINAVNWEVSKDLSHMEYMEQWIDKELAEKQDNSIFDHIRITKIYSNCFFAKTVIPMPYEIKLNGTLSDEWCVGDQIKCTYENTYYDQRTNRVEADMLTVEASDWEPEPGVAYKPVIYLYPEKEMEVSVKLELNGRLTCTYPAYKDGWSVTARPDGTLTDAKGQIYNYLYWEGETSVKYDFSKGFCVKGKDTASFLENALAKQGLSRREANEFIVYWLPLMEQNPYNVISFQTDIYTDAAKLEVNPKPDTIIRVFMAWKKSDTFLDIPQQEFVTPARKGFTIVEWGGSEVR